MIDDAAHRLRFSKRRPGSPGDASIARSTIEERVPAENGSEVDADRMNVLFRTMRFRVKYYTATASLS